MRADPKADSMDVNLVAMTAEQMAASKVDSKAVYSAASWAELRAASMAIIKY